MATSPIQDDQVSKIGDEERRISTSASPSVTAVMSQEETSEESRTEIGNSREQERQHVGAHLHHSPSHPIHLEPPPVVRRPKKIRQDGFDVRYFSWLAWNWSEEMDGLFCSRSMHKSYTWDASFRFFGIKFSKNITVQFSESGVDSAIQTTTMGERRWVHDELSKARKVLEKHPGGGQRVGRREGEAKSEPTSHQSKVTDTDVERQKEKGETGPDADDWIPDHYYVVVGFMGDESVPKETLRRIDHPEALFQQLRKAHKHLRNPIRRALSLKEVSGFGIYECDPIKGYHREMTLDNDTERTLAELWRSYRSHKHDYGGRWLKWIHQNFNNGSSNPQDGRLTLEFKLRWSIPKTVFWGVIPVLLSLGVGFGYMYKDHGEVTDRVAIAEAAWVIASYIVTASALLLALLAVCTQFGDV